MFLYTVCKYIHNAYVARIAHGDDNKNDSKETSSPTTKTCPMNKLVVLIKICTRNKLDSFIGALHEVLVQLCALLAYKFLFTMYRFNLHCDPFIVSQNCAVPASQYNLRCWPDKETCYKMHGPIAYDVYNSIDRPCDIYICINCLVAHISSWRSLSASSQWRNS